MTYGVILFYYDGNLKQYIVLTDSEKMVFDKYNAPVETRHLQRWCNNKIIFNSVPKFADYNQSFKTNKVGEKDVA